MAKKRRLSEYWILFFTLLFLFSCRVTVPAAAKENGPNGSVSAYQRLFKHDPSIEWRFLSHTSSETGVLQFRILDAQSGQYLSGIRQNGKTPWNRFSKRITKIEFNAPDGAEVPLILGDDRLFAGLPRLKAVTCRGIGDIELHSYTFANDPCLKKVSFLSTDNPHSLLIGKGAFAGDSSLGKKLILPDLAVIQKWAFRNCTGIKRITCLCHPNEIHKQAFDGISATFYGSDADWFPLIGKYISGSYRLDGLENIPCGEHATCSFSRSGTLTIQGTGDITDYVHDYNPPWYPIRNKIKKIVVKEGITSIGAYAFAETSCRCAVLPESLTSIGNDAFLNTKLQKIVLPDSLISIGDSAFSGTKLQEITFPDSLETIGRFAFSGCKWNAPLHFGKNLKSVGYLAFEHVQVVEFDGKPPVMVVYSFGYISSKQTYKYILIHDEKAWEKIIETTNRTIIEDAVWVTSFRKPSKKNPIGWYYSPQSELLYILGKGTIKQSLFKSLPTKKIRNVRVAEGIEGIESRAFWGFDSLSITLPASLKRIEKDAFRGHRHFTAYNRKEKVVNPLRDPATGEIRMITVEGEELDCRRYKQLDLSMFLGNRELERILVSRDTVLSLPWKDRKKVTFSILSYEYTQAEAFCRLYGIPFISLANGMSLQQEWGLSEFTYSFPNSRKAFSYGKKDTIPLERYIRVFGDTELAREIYAENRTWAGNCFGMSASAVLANNRDSVKKAPLQLQAYTTDECRPGDTEKRSGQTLKTVIEILQVSQFLDEIQDVFYANENNLDKIVKNAQKPQNAENTNHFLQPGLIALFWPGGGHCVVGYHLQDVDDTRSLLYIYDSNYPEKKRYIELKRSPEGAYTGWSYKLAKGMRVGSDIDGCSISSVPYRHIEKIWSDYLSGKTRSNQSSLLMVHLDAFALLDASGKEIARMQNGIFSSSRADVYQANLFFGAENVDGPVYIYLPSTLEVTVKALKQGRKEKSVWEAVLAGKDCSVRIRTDSRQISLNAADAKACSGAISTKKGTTWQISITTKTGGKRRRTATSGRGDGSTVSLWP